MSERAPASGSGSASRVLHALVAGGCYALCVWLGAAISLELYGATRPIPDAASTVVVAGAAPSPTACPPT